MHAVTWKYTQLMLMVVTDTWIKLASISSIITLVDSPSTKHLPQAK